MPKDMTIKKVLVIGSGPIVIGQAAEFDYAGTQACKALREEGIKVVLLNSNPATIMTDNDVADKVYIEPMSVESLTAIIEKERPDGVLGTLGGQTGLNLVTELHNLGILAKYNVRLLGTSVDAIKKAEDRDSFKKLMQEINEPIATSTIVSNVEDSVKFADEIGYPLVVRPAFTLGGTGGGIAYNEDDLKEIVYQGLLYSPICQVLLEESVLGWKEIEFEVMRDSNDTTIIICDMENIDPVGIHTGDSIVVAPSQTMSQAEYKMLYDASIKIMKALKIAGGCNIQFALNPDNGEYIVIEINPRVSRSSALASKATGYPIAKVTAKIAIGMNLEEIKTCYSVKTGKVFEPAVDYIVIKIPKWPFDKFPYANRQLGTQMKATGEVMALDRTFESAFLKALICLENQKVGLRKKKYEPLSAEELVDKIQNPDDRRIYAIAEGLRKGLTVDEIHDLTKIDKFFLGKIKNIIDTEKRLLHEEFNSELLHIAESMGFTDEEICNLSKQPLEILDTMRRAHDMYPVYKKVDSCAEGYDELPPYYYSTYSAVKDENAITNHEKVIVIGSGPIRIGQGIEFDYCSVHAVQGIKDNGFEAIIINNNPETVSTDFDISDKLYFEPLYIEDVCNVIRKEMPKGVIVQFGGQTAINLAPKLLKRGVQILGTSVESINVAEDRKRFEMLLRELKIEQPKSIAVTNEAEALKAAAEIGYPVLLRPSYVTGGRAMKVVCDDTELSEYIANAVSISPEYPVSIDQYIEGKEFEIDVICDRTDILIPAIMEHIERTGIHSGDSFFVTPHRSLSDKVIEKVVEYTQKISKALQIIGLMNIQFIAKDDKVYVIEVNPRASRTVPIISKITKIPMVKIAVNLLLSQKLKDQGYGIGLAKQNPLYAVKAPVFSFQKLNGVDIALNAEMKSTGEVLGLDTCYEKALIKAFIAAGVEFVPQGDVLAIFKNSDLEESIEYILRLKSLGFNILTSKNNAEFYTGKGISVDVIDKFDIKSIHTKTKNKEIKFIVNTPTVGGSQNRSGYKIRALATQYRTPCFTCLDTLNAYLTAWKYYKKNPSVEHKTIDEYLAESNIENLLG